MTTKPLTLAASLAALGLLAACSTNPAMEDSAHPGSPLGTGASSGASARGLAGQSAPSARQDAAIGERSAAKRSVYYELDRYELKSDQVETVEANASYLHKHPEIMLRIEGNADERGSREYNLALGQRRAEAVMRTLGLLGIPESRMESISYGKERPRALGHDEESWAENRRADLVYP